MFAIAITDRSQKHIAEKYNDGVIPALGKDDPDNPSGEDTYYIVEDDGPNRIVTTDEFYGTDLWQKANVTVL